MLLSTQNIDAHFSPRCYAMTALSPLSYAVTFFFFFFDISLIFYAAAGSSPSPQPRHAAAAAFFRCCCCHAAFTLFSFALFAAYAFEALRFRHAAMMPPLISMLLRFIFAAFPP